MALTAVLVMLAPASAHVRPIPIEDWGSFSPGTVTCLRVVSRATQTCFDIVLAELQRCNDAIVRGEGCDTEEADAKVAQASSRLGRALTSQCTLTQLTDLGYGDFFDAQSDLFNSCVSQARGAVSATYAPALAGPPSEAAAACMVASAAYGRKVIRLALQWEVPVMERIAARPFTTEEKTDSLQRVESELGTAREHWVAGLLGVCPDFAAVYGRSADSFLRTLKQRADCWLSNIYIHTEVRCLGQVCGNGITEGMEECDDGNRDDTDTCRTNCTLTSP